MAENPAYSEDELLEQWAFLDQMVARQAAQLSAGIQDEEDDTSQAPAVLPSPSPDMVTAARERDDLRAQVAVLEARVGELSAEIERLRVDNAGLHRHIGDGAAQIDALRKEVALRDTAAAQGRARIAELQRALESARRAAPAASAPAPQPAHPAPTATPPHQPSAAPPPTGGQIGAVPSQPAPPAPVTPPADRARRWPWSR